ncbi:uncharacterized protein [Dasypus novemcinctus]|uniref:uncharacterized protein n=1 Tax=Dasypus novemcinctus TaxID=9361 RepID=UPI0039C9CEEC
MYIYIYIWSVRWVSEAREGQAGEQQCGRSGWCKEKPGRRQPGAAAAVAAAGSAAPPAALPGALRGSRSGQDRELEPGGAGEVLARGGGRGARSREGARRSLPATAGPHQRDGQLRRALAPPHTHAHSHPRSHPRGSRPGIAGSPAPLVARIPPRRVLTVPICIGGNFLRASHRSRRRPLRPPLAASTLRPGLAPADPPLPLRSPPRGLHHIPPWSVAHARGRARGSGARGCACIARLLLAAHTVHGSEGASEGGTGPLRLLPRRRRQLWLRLLRGSLPPAPRRPPRAEAAADAGRLAGRRHGL